MKLRTELTTVFSVVLIAFAAVSGAICNPVAAYVSNKRITGVSYEMPGDNDFNWSESNRTNLLCYGKESIGALYFDDNDNIEKREDYSFYSAFSSDSELSLSYRYDGSLQSDNKDEWNLTESASKTLGEINLSSKMELGAIVVQSTSDGQNWGTDNIIVNAFEKNTLSIAEISVSDLKQGKYYRVLIGYRLRKRTKAKSGWFSSDEYEYKNFVEKYELYVSYSKNAVVLRDLNTGKDISGNSTVQDGFIVDKCGSSYSVSISKDGGASYSVDDLTTIAAPGKYRVNIQSKNNTSYTYSIEVTKGTEFAEAVPRIYDGGKKGEYTEDAAGNATSFGIRSLTTLKIGQPYGNHIGKSEKNQFDSYGIAGDKAGLFLRLKRPNAYEKWSIESDSWGEKEKQTVNGVYIGKIETGALLIQKSYDGTEWVKIDDHQYKSGLNTTDYYTNYSSLGDVHVYTPDGNDLTKGVYLKISYAYKAYNPETGNNTRCLEVYNLYLCCNELGAVTIHNLSCQDNISNYSKSGHLGEEQEKIDYNIYQYAETLLSGSGTVKGFRIDNSQNPTVSISVKWKKPQSKDFTPISISDNEYAFPGKYSITLQSAVGDKKDITIYVDSNNPEEAYKTYFPKDFISGKRIFTKGDYATYEGGKTEWSITQPADTYLPLNGTIKNTTTGFEIPISAYSPNQKGTITQAGHYVARLTTRPPGQPDDFPGDYRVFKYEFDVIPENASPGPVENQNNLKVHAKDTISDSYPRYYGVTYPSADKGDITLAFATREEAVKFAYEYEKGIVEKRNDGTYLYRGALKTKKTTYSSAWDLTDAMNYFAEQAVNELYFDLSDEDNVRTISPKDLKTTDNLRTIELARSVVVFANDAQKDELCSFVNALPIISPKPYRYQKFGREGEEEHGFTDFQFIADKYRCDSDSIVITDCNGRTYYIGYEVNVGSFLQSVRCPSGIITITERNKYQEKAEYQAVFIASGDNTAELKLFCYQGEEKTFQSFQKTDNGRSIKVDAFRIEELTDSLDPYSIVKVRKDKGEPEYYVAGQKSTKAWSDDGIYDVTVVNRLGYTYSISIEIKDSKYAVLTFDGIGTEETDAIVTSMGDHNIPLPLLHRYGYELEGFSDEDGNRYTNEIASIMFKGNKLLTAVWKAKQYKISLQDEDGNILRTDTIAFDQKYSLPTIDLIEGYSVLAWKENGVQLEDFSYTLKSENDVVLTAVLEKKQTDPTVQEELTDTTGGFWIFGLITAFTASAAAVGVLLLWRKKKNKQPTGEIKPTDSENGGPSA